MTNGQLDANLRRFYAEARKKDGETYGKKTLLGFRHGIERYLNKPKFSRNLKMSTDPRFTRSNQMLDAQLVQLKKLGKENSQHKPTLENEDMERLKSSDALRNVWFSYCFVLLQTRPRRATRAAEIQLQTGCRCEREKLRDHGAR